ncbi:MAG: S8 family peptidase [Herbinix sp.]|nr:S8 family peptidase [Herbinix sp.]
MTSQENPIISEDFADLLLEYAGDIAIFEPFGSAPVNIINDFAAVVHIPVQQMTSNSVLEFGYAAIPSLFGLVSHESLEASGIFRLRNIPNFDLRGQGVLVGIIDTGIDYTNPIFQNSDKTTRIVSIWDQTIVSENPPEGRGYGTDFAREQINQALQTEDPYQVVPSRDENGHGTMVAGIAGGAQVPESDFEGVAPGVEFVVVKLKQAKKYLRDFFFIPDEAVCYQETDLLSAIEYVLNTSVILQKPIVLCIALNTSQSAHDGRGMTSSYLSTVATRSGTGVVVAAGNEGNARRHYFGLVSSSVGYDVVELNVGENEKGFSMELWGQSPSIFSIDILSPSGEYIPRITAVRNENREINFVFEITTIYIDYRIVESESGDQLILMRFSNPSPGIWRFNVYERGNLNIGFHIWLPMEGFISNNTFFIRSDPYTTILALGNAQIPVTITAYNNADDSLFINSSKGYTRLGAVKPNIAAPGVNIIGPTLDHGFKEFTGTSISCSHTAGVVAMILEWGVVKGNLLGMSTIEINKLLMRGARREVGVEYPNRDWGFGILDIYNVFDSLRSGAV